MSVTERDIETKKLAAPNSDKDAICQAACAAYTQHGAGAGASSSAGNNRTAESSPSNCSSDKIFGRCTIEGTLSKSATEPAPSDKLVLSKLADSGLSQERLARVAANFTQFEKTAKSNHVTDSQVKETYKQMDRILGAKEASVDPQLRAQFVEQWSGKLADPHTITQGWHNTCAMAVYEFNKLKRHPEDITRLAADAVVDGKVAINTKPSLAEGKDRIFLNFDSASLKPDVEAAGKADHVNARDYGDQVAQVALSTVKWGTSKVTPFKETIAPGSIQYKQCEEASRLPAKVACEAIEIADTTTGAVDTYTSRTNRNIIGATDDDVARIDAALNPEHSQSFVYHREVWAKLEQKHILEVSQRLDLLPRDDAYHSGASAIHNDVNGLLEFKSFLEEAKAGDKFPLAASVFIARPGFREDYLKVNPDLTTVPKIGAHSISIEGINHDGTIKVFNPMGITKDMTVSDLYNAMVAPEDN